MFERVRDLVLRFLRVPPEPDPPFGEPSSLRVFRASRKLYWLRLIGWGAGQIAALAGILFWLGVLMTAEHEADRARAETNARGRPAPLLGTGRHRQASLSQGFKTAVARVPQFVFALLWLAKALGVGLYFGQIAITYAAVRLDYEMRWYLVTDRSLRIRSGLWTVEEMTMSFANLQQVMVCQGPLQRLLGIADVRVQSAGGGGGAAGSEHEQGNPMHTGVFHGVEHAAEVRDLILKRLRHFRETGLGDPDEVGPASADLAPSSQSDALSAARGLLAEARLLHQVIESGPIDS